MPYPANLNWVEFAQPQDRKLFRAIAHDAKLPSTSLKATSGRRPSVLASSASPSQVTVTVLNGSGASGKAGQIGRGLASRGFHVKKTGNAPHNRIVVQMTGDMIAAGRRVSIQSDAYSSRAVRSIGSTEVAVRMEPVKFFVAGCACVY